MSAVDEQLFAGGWLPDMHGIVLAGRGNVSAIRRPGKISYRAIVSHVSAKWRSCCCIPDMDYPHFSRGKVFAIGRPVHGGDPASVLIVCKNTSPSIRLIYLYCLTPCARNMRAIRRPGNSTRRGRFDERIAQIDF